LNIGRVSGLVSRLRSVVSRGGRRDVRVEEREHGEESVGERGVIRVTGGGGRLIVVGGVKGGSGKSFVASNLTIVLSLASGRRSGRVLAVDTDTSNVTLTLQLLSRPIHTALREWVLEGGEQLDKIRELDHASFIEILKGLEKRSVLRVKHTINSCRGVGLKTTVSLIPSIPLVNAVMIGRRSITDLEEGELRSGVRRLLDFIETVRRRYQYIVVDLIPWSGTIPQETILYNSLLDYADIAIVVADPEGLNPTEITTRFGRSGEKTIVVINKVTASSIEDPLVQSRIRLLHDSGFTIHLIPLDQKYEKKEFDTLYKIYRIPTIDGLDTRVSIAIQSLASRLGETPVEDCENMVVEYTRRMNSILDAITGR